MLLIFDCDGVVVDSMTIHTEVEAEAYRTLGIDMTPAEIGRRYAGVSQAAILESFARERGCAVPPGFEAMIEQKKEQAFRARLRPIPGVEQALARLKGIPRCLASGARMEQLRLTLSLTHLYDAFAPNVFSAEMVKRGKPAPDLFLLAAERMGHPPQDCVVIEDGAAGVQGAKAAGMRAIGFTGDASCGKDHAAWLREAGAQAVFADMGQLPRLVKSMA